MNHGVTRRDLLRLGAAAAAAAGLQTARSEENRPVRLGVIGVGNRGTHLLRLALAAGVEVPALCDINPSHLRRAQDVVEKAGAGPRPVGYAEGPTDYRRMLQRDDLDAVIVATPMQDHAPMSVDALRAGKDVLSEVAAAMTLDQCWGLVHAAEETGKIYMLSENCCFWEHVMAVGNMVRQGLFGELTFAECGYVHDCRALDFQPDGTLTWRGELSRNHAGNLYPTHQFGPVARWLGINRGDRMVSLVAMATRGAAMKYYVEGRFPEGHPARQIKFRSPDSTTVLARTARGVLIDIRYDVKSARPHPTTVYYSLQGLKASYDSRIGPDPRIGSVWIEGRSRGHQWEPLSKYLGQFEDPLWAEGRQQAEGSGHGGADFFCLRAFLEAVQSGGPSPIDVYDAAAWSAIIPLSAQSLAQGSTPQTVPDFTQGRWETRQT